MFVADNVKEVIPDFLLLLKGTIDCPDIPLNVSRSFLQNDGYVQKISDYITRKVADKLKQLFTTERENYQKYWQDIHPFIKYGCLRNEKFYDRLQDAVLYKIAGAEEYVTLQEYLDAAKETNENKVFYTTDARQQARYIEALSGQQIKTVELPAAIDVPFVSLIESKKEGVKFFRVDANLSEALKDDSLETDQDMSEKATALFGRLLEGKNITVRFEAMKDPDIAALLEQPEEQRRFAEMMKMYGMNAGFPNQPQGEVLVVNSANASVKQLLTAPEGELRDACALQIYDLARLSDRPLEADELKEFIRRSQDLLYKALS